jgi:chemotaxis signal transduction protein
MTIQDRGLSSAVELELLIFTVGGIAMAVDTAQVEEMLRPAEAERREVETRMFHENLFSGERASSYSEPMVLMIREGPPYGIVVDRPDEITKVPLQRIQPLPALIEKHALSKAVWGIALKDDKMIMLVDFYQLPVMEAMKIKPKIRQ